MNETELDYLPKPKKHRWWLLAGLVGLIIIWRRRK